MASNSAQCWAFAFRGYCRILLALGAVPGVGWKAAAVFTACIPVRLRQQAARAYLGSRD